MELCTNQQTMLAIWQFENVEKLADSCENDSDTIRIDADLKTTRIAVNDAMRRKDLRELRQILDLFYDRHPLLRVVMIRSVCPHE